jgi:transposase
MGCLIDLARDGLAANRLARRANALVLPEDGMSCGDVAKVLFGDDTVRTCYGLYEDEDIEGLASFGYDGSACRLSDQQQAKLKAWITETLPRTTREVGVWIEKNTASSNRADRVWSRCCIGWAWSIASRKRCRPSWTLTSRTPSAPATDDKPAKPQE